MNQQPEIRFPEPASNGSVDGPVPEINLPGPDSASNDIPVELPERPQAGIGNVPTSQPLS